MLFLQQKEFWLRNQKPLDSRCFCRRITKYVHNIVQPQDYTSLAVRAISYQNCNSYGASSLRRCRVLCVSGRNGSVPQVLRLGGLKSELALSSRSRRKERDMSLTYSPEKSVHVSAYGRFRMGKWETVRAHYRSFPK